MDMEKLRLIVENEVNKGNDRQFEKMKAYFVSSTQCSERREKHKAIEIKEEKSRAAKYGKVTTKYTAIITVIVSIVMAIGELKGRLGL